MSTTLPDDVILFTNSSMANFKTCRRMAYFANMLWLEKNEQAPSNLTVGKAIHAGIERHLLLAKGDRFDKVDCTTESLKHVVDSIDRIKTLVMISNYCKTYKNDKDRFEIIKIEYEFISEIFNEYSNRYAFGGKIDGLVREKSTGLYYLIEHKTTSRIDNGYISSLWMNTQIAFYSALLEILLNIKIHGVIYDIIEKPQISPKEGETEAEFQDRYNAAKNKKLVKRKMPESDSDFSARCNELYADGSKLRRELILIPEWEKEKTLSEAHSIVADWLEAAEQPKLVSTSEKDIFAVIRENNCQCSRMYRNTSSCFKWNKPCRFLPICQSNESRSIIDSLYRIRTVSHSELGSGESELVELAF